MLRLSLEPIKLLASFIRQRFTVRIHTNLAGYRWAKLWYFLRGIDYQGSGFARIALADLCEFLGAKPSTIYEWLRLGEEDGAFRRWRVSRGILKIALGSLVKVCVKKQIPWGIVGEIPLYEVSNLRANATGITAQKFQERSRYAAWRSLSRQNRLNYKLPYPDAFFRGGDGQLSDDSPQGSIPCLLHIGRRRLFVSKGFIPFGTSQSTIAHERSMSDRTVRRHLNKIEMERRQIVQAKGVYSLVKQALDYVVDFESEKEAVSVRFPDSLGFGEAVLAERPGGVGKECYTRLRAGRVFSYAGKDWLYRCNIYKPTFDLKTMRYRLSEYKAALERVTTSPRRGDITLCKDVRNSFRGFVPRASSAGEKAGQNP